jgi:hypothetical protein
MINYVCSRFERDNIVALNCGRAAVHIAALRDEAPQQPDLRPGQPHSFKIWPKKGGVVKKTAAMQTGEVETFNREPRQIR